jgi:hypothetical protein
MQYRENHSDEQYAAYLIKRMGLLEFQLSFPGSTMHPFTRAQVKYELTNLYLEIERVSDPIVLSLFTLNNGVLYA